MYDATPLMPAPVSLPRAPGCLPDAFGLPGLPVLTHFQWLTCNPYLFAPEHCRVPFTREPSYAVRPVGVLWTLRSPYITCWHVTRAIDCYISYDAVKPAGATTHIRSCLLPAAFVLLSSLISYAVFTCRKLPLSLLPTAGCTAVRCSTAVSRLGWRLQAYSCTSTTT